VSAYCRVSTDKEDQSHSLKNQIAFFNDYINKHPHWTMGQIYYDEGITGTSIKKRDAFNRMINDGLNNKFDYLLTKEVSRFARNTVDTLKFTRQLKTKNVGVYFLNDNINTLDSDGELRLSIMASIAQEESRKTSERVKWGQQRAMEQGVVFGSGILGYKLEGGRLSIVQEEAHIIRLIFNEFALKNKGTYTIAKDLTNSNLSAKKNKAKWSASSIHKILKNEKYVGDLCQRKSYTADFLTKEKKYDTKTDDLIYIKNHHEAIIDRHVWEAAQDKLAKNAPSQDRKKKYSNRYWCSSKIICHECKNTFISKIHKLKSSVCIKTWKCLKANNFGVDEHKGGCNSDVVNEKLLTMLVPAAIEHIKIDKDALTKEILQKIQSLSPSQKIVDIPFLQSQIVQLNSKKKRVLDLVQEGILFDDDIAQQIKYYDHEIDRLFQSIGNAKIQQHLMHNEQASLELYNTELQKILSFDDIKSPFLYRSLIDKIEIFPNKKAAVYLASFKYGLLFSYKKTGRGATYSFDIKTVGIIF